MPTSGSPAVQPWQASHPKGRSLIFGHYRIPTCHHLRIKMAARAFANVVHGLGDRARSAVRTRAGHCVKYIDDGQHPSPGMNFLALETDRVTFAVESLVMLIN